MKIIVQKGYEKKGSEVLSYAEDKKGYIWLELLGKKDDVEFIVSAIRKTLRNELGDVSKAPYIRYDRGGMHSLKFGFGIYSLGIKKQEISHGYEHLIIYRRDLISHKMRYLIGKDTNDIVEQFKKWLLEINPFPYPAGKRINDKAIEELLFSRFVVSGILESVESEGIRIYRFTHEPHSQKIADLLLQTSREAKVFEIDRYIDYLEREALALGETAEMEEVEVLIAFNDTDGNRYFVIEYEPALKTAFVMKVGRGGEIEYKEIDFESLYNDSKIVPVAEKSFKRYLIDINGNISRKTL